MDWGPLYKKLAEAYHWTPEQVRSLTLHDIEILIFNRSESKQKTWSAEEQLQRRNEIRAKAGKPPIQPRVRQHGRRTTKTS